jgi:hypothetical protein
METRSKSRHPVWTSEKGQDIDRSGVNNEMEVSITEFYNETWNKATDGE